MIRAIQFQNKRVGSTFLQKAIDSHPQIVGVDEVFVNIARKAGMKKSGFTPFVRSDYQSAEKYVREVIWSKHPGNHVIFKLMYNQITHHTGGLFSFVHKNKIPIIHLMRRNLVKQIISGHNAATTKHDPVSITPENLLHNVKEADKLNNHWRGFFNEHKKLELYYEDIIGQTINEFTFVEESANIDICNFFEVDHFTLHAATKKKNKNNIWVYLKNREEIEKKFNGTKYQWMIEEE